MFTKSSGQEGINHNAAKIAVPWIIHHTCIYVYRIHDLCFPLTVFHLCVYIYIYMITLTIIDIYHINSKYLQICHTRGLVGHINSKYLQICHTRGLVGQCPTFLDRQAGLQGPLRLFQAISRSHQTCLGGITGNGFPWFSGFMLFPVVSSCFMLFTNDYQHICMFIYIYIHDTKKKIRTTNSREFGLLASEEVPKIHMFHADILQANRNSWHIYIYTYANLIHIYIYIDL